VGALVGVGGDGVETEQVGLGQVQGREALSNLRRPGVDVAREELSGSEWAHVVHKHLGGLPPAVDLAGEKALAELLREAVGLVTSAHDLSDGGLAQALAESVLRNGVGTTVSVEGDPFVALFSESAGRVLVTVPSAGVARLASLAERHDVPVTAIGGTGGDSLVVEGEFEVALPVLRDTWSRTLPDALGS
jgi:phosphoribosylformylglycinamidine synthase